MRLKQLGVVALGFVFLVNIVGSGTGAAATRARKLCSRVVAGQARCFASVLTDASGIEPLTVGAPRGYGPADFKATYGNRDGTSSVHVAIVSAYDAPSIEADLGTYSRIYGLPQMPTCSGRRVPGCLEKLNQRGLTTPLPAANSSWSVEAALDAETIHGMCPSCSITLVEASSASIANLSSAVDAAVASGATIVSNSYGGPEFAAEVGVDVHYSRPGVTMVASSGDSGFGTSYPAASPAVVAVGGTSLQLHSGRALEEIVWPGSGSGCSQYEVKPAWQNDQHCKRRSVADVAADADPATGAAIYASYGRFGRGWMTLGGTSLAAPLVAGSLASSNKAGGLPAKLYSSGAAVNLRDIASGANGSCRSYLCRATSGYDGPTGMGVLNHW